MFVKYFAPPIFLVALFSAGCGTGIGNALHSIGNDSLSVPTGLVSADIANYVCVKIESCLAITPAHCYDEVLQSTSIDTEIGLAEGAYINFQAIVAAELSGDIIPDKITAMTCVSDLLALSCDNPEVQNSYQPTQANPFAGLGGILPGSCRGVL
jgi:hypothetical protein